MEAEESSDASFRLQLGLIDVEVHPVDAFDFQGHMLPRTSATDVVDSWLAPVVTTPRGQPTASRFNWGCVSIPTLRHDRSLLFTSRRSEAKPR